MAKQSTGTGGRKGTGGRDGAEQSGVCGDIGVRDDMQDMWDASRDVVDGSCQVLSSLVIGIGEALAPRDRSSRDKNDASTDA